LAKVETPRQLKRGGARIHLRKLSILIANSTLLKKGLGGEGKETSTGGGSKGKEMIRAKGRRFPIEKKQTPTPERGEIITKELGRWQGRKGGGRKKSGSDLSFQKKHTPLLTSLTKPFGGGPTGKKKKTLIEGRRTVTSCRALPSCKEGVNMTRKKRGGHGGRLDRANWRQDGSVWGNYLIGGGRGEEKLPMNDKKTGAKEERS